MQRYVNAEKRKLVAANDNLWDKYAMSCRAMELQRSATLKKLGGYLSALGYVQ
jgi:hypothetical protein